MHEKNLYDLYTAYKNERDDEETQLPEESPMSLLLVRQLPSKNTMIAPKEKSDRRFCNTERPSRSGLGSADRPSSSSKSKTLSVQTTQYIEVTKYLNTT